LRPQALLLSETRVVADIEILDVYVRSRLGCGWLRRILVVESIDGPLTRVKRDAAGAASRPRGVILVDVGLGALYAG
jgi:hypothetical protein